MTDDVRDYFDPPNKENKTTCNLCSQSFQFDLDMMVEHLNKKHGKQATADGILSYAQQCADEKAEFTPKTGYNVVEFDDFSPPGEMLTKIGHFDTREEAEKFAKENDSKDLPVYVYGPDDE